MNKRSAEICAAIAGVPIALMTLAAAASTSQTETPPPTPHPTLSKTPKPSKPPSNQVGGTTGNRDIFATASSGRSDRGVGRPVTGSSIPVVSKPIKPRTYTCEFRETWQEYGGRPLTADEGSSSDSQRWATWVTTEETRQSNGARQMLRVCKAKPGFEGTDVPPREVVWVGGPGGPGSFRAVDPLVLAQDALASATLPEPVIAGTSPDPTSDRPPLVNMPLWWWVNEPAPVTARATAGTVWAEVTATPVGTTWVRSDGQEEHCGGFGIPWQRHLSENNSSACTVTYQKTSDPETAQVRLTWKVTWRSNIGAGGDLGTTTTATTWNGRIWQRQVVIVQNSPS